MQRQQGRIVEQALHRPVIRDHIALHEQALAIGQQAQRRILPGFFLPVQGGTVAHGTDVARLHGLGQTVQRGRKGLVVDTALAQPTADTAGRQALCVRQQGGRLIQAVTHDTVHVIRQEVQQQFPAKGQLAQPFGIEARAGAVSGPVQAVGHLAPQLMPDDLAEMGAFQLVDEPGHGLLGAVEEPGKFCEPYRLRRCQQQGVEREHLFRRAAL